MRGEGRKRGKKADLLEKIEKYTQICNGVILLHIFHDMLIPLHTIHPEFMDI